MTAVLAGLAVSVATWLLLAGRAPVRSTPPTPDRAARTRPTAGAERVRPARWALSLLAGVGCWILVPGWPGVVLGLGAPVLAHRLLAATEPAAVRREREAVRRELPVVVLLLGTALGGGAAVGPAVRQVCAALPGPASARLSRVVDRLALGVDPERVWTALADDPELAPLGRTLARAHRTGAPVARAVQRLADDLAATARSEVTDRARSVGVRAAVPLGVCLLPSFLLLGIVPLVATLLSGLRL